MKVIFGVDSSGIFVNQGGEKFYADADVKNKLHASMSKELRETKAELEKTKAMLLTEMRRKQPDIGQLRIAIDKVKSIVKGL